jgi:hypothetical protein
MKISNNFPIIQQTDALLIVSDTQAAKIYRLENGQIRKLEQIEADVLEYTDREPEVRGHANTRGVSNETEKKFLAVRDNFLTKFRQAIKKISEMHQYKEIYLVAPSRIKPALIEMIPNDEQDKITQQLAGNYMKRHLFDIFSKFQTRFDRLRAKMQDIHDSRETRELLEKTSAARRIMGSAY